MTRSAEQPRTSARQKLLLALFGVGVALLAIVLAEAVLTALGVGAEDRHADPFVGFAPGVPVFTESSGADGRRMMATSPAKLAFFEPQQFPRDKPRGSFRVFAVGGSTVAGRPYDHRVAFAAWLERYLAAADPDRRFEVINAGAISYASYRVALVMQELTAYAPDLFVVLTGHNEFLEERSYADIIHRPSALKALGFRLSRLRIASLARSLVDRRPDALPTLAAEVTTRLEGWTGLARYHRDDELEAAIVAHFTANLARMVAIARDAGAEIVFIAPASNLGDFSPFKSEHSDLEAGARQRFEAAYAAGRAALDAGDAAAAASALETAVAIDPRFADAQFRRGQAAFASGRHADAKAAFVRAKDEDTAPLRALEPIVAAVHQVSAEAGVHLLDLPALLEADSRARFGHDILGNAYFLDHVHPDIPIHSLIAEKLLGWMASRGWVRLGPGWSPAARRSIEQEVLAGLDREDYARRDIALARVLGWAGKLAEAEIPLRRAAEVLPDAPEVHRDLGILLEKTGRPAEAAIELERAASGLGNDPEVLFNLGVVAGQRGDPAAGIGFLRRAITARPDYAEAHHNLGVLLRRHGELEAAAQSLETASRLAPDIADVHRALGLTYRRLGRSGDALAEFDRAISLDPRDLEAKLERGITLATRGDLAAAAAAFEVVLAADPENAEAWYNLGLTESGRSQTDAAIAAYRRALEAGPRHVLANNNLAILLAGRGQLEDAAALLETAIAAAPDYADGHFNLGLVRERQTDRAGADTAFARALALDSENARYHHAMGMALLGRGDVAGARERLRRAKDLGADVPADLLAQLGRR